MGIEAVEDRNCWTPWQFLLEGPCTDLLRLTTSELQHGGNRLKGTRDIQGLPGIRVRAGRQLSPRGHYSFSDPSPNKATELA